METLGNILHGEVIVRRSATQSSSGLETHTARHLVNRVQALAGLALLATGASLAGIKRNWLLGAGCALAGLGITAASAKKVGVSTTFKYERGKKTYQYRFVDWSFLPRICYQNIANTLLGMVVDQKCDDELTLHKLPHRDELYNARLEASHDLQLQHLEDPNGTFTFGTDLHRIPGQMAWGPNFGDPGGLFFHALGKKCAQEELLALSAPTLSVVRQGGEADSTQGYVNLLCGAKQRLQFDLAKRDGYTIYGDDFNQLNWSQVAPRITPVQDPQAINIYTIVAKSGVKDQPYTQDEINFMLEQAYAAFKGMKEAYPDKKHYVEMGNWGAGAYGNDVRATAIIQLLAADVAGIDFVNFISREKFNEVVQAIAIYRDIKRGMGNEDLAGMVLALEARFAQEGIVWRSGDGN